MSVIQFKSIAQFTKNKGHTKHGGDNELLESRGGGGDGEVRASDLNDKSERVWFI